MWLLLFKRNCFAGMLLTSFVGQNFELKKNTNINFNFKKIINKNMHFINICFLHDWRHFGVQITNCCFTCKISLKQKWSNLSHPLLKKRNMYDCNYQRDQLCSSTYSNIIAWIMHIKCINYKCYISSFSLYIILWLLTFWYKNGNPPDYSDLSCIRFKNGRIRQKFII